MTEGPQGQRRGWLKNGNRPGDFTTAARCGAKTRQGTPCRAPGMRNGRCRLHGGASTGPRTAEGLERCRRARLKHGWYSAEVQTRLAEVREIRRKMRRGFAIGTRRGGASLRRRSALTTPPTEADAALKTDPVADRTAAPHNGNASGARRDIESVGVARDQARHRRRDREFHSYRLYGWRRMCGPLGGGCTRPWSSPG
jgi:hypothetical protein